MSAEPKNVDWVALSKSVFRVEKPEHFTDFTHCDECAEHDETLRTSSVDTIGLAELGNPGWDPICFCSVQGKQYYTPALIRLSLETAENEFYFGQYLFHLLYRRQNDDFYLGCSEEQRRFLANFIQHMINTYPSQLEVNFCVEDAFHAYEIWAADNL